MMMTHVDMLRNRVRHGVLCQLFGALRFVKNLHAWYAASRQNKTPRVPLKKSLLGTLTHGHVFGVCGRKRNAVLPC